MSIDTLKLGTDRAKILLVNKVMPARKIVEKMWCDNTNMLLKLSNPTAFTLGKIIDIVDRAR